MKGHWGTPLANTIAALLVLTGCGAERVEGRAPAEASAAPAPARDALATIRDAVRPGRYDLRLWLRCDAGEKTASGTLTLRPIAPGEPGGDAQGTSPLSEGPLLWGQTDLELAALSPCLGPFAPPGGEPIHPSVLVEVLRWDGATQQQVLLVSLDPARGSAPGVGIAMWVERVGPGHMAGVWSRWDLVGRGEGRWEAKLLPEP